MFFERRGRSTGGCPPAAGLHPTSNIWAWESLALSMGTDPLKIHNNQSIDRLIPTLFPPWVSRWSSDAVLRRVAKAAKNAKEKRTTGHKGREGRKGIIEIRATSKVAKKPRQGWYTGSTFGTIDAGSSLPCISIPIDVASPSLGVVFASLASTTPAATLCDPSSGRRGIQHWRLAA